MYHNTTTTWAHQARQRVRVTARLATVVRDHTSSVFAPCSIHCRHPDAQVAHHSMSSPVFLDWPNVNVPWKIFLTTYQNSTSAIHAYEQSLTRVFIPHSGGHLQKLRPPSCLFSPEPQDSPQNSFYTLSTPSMMIISHYLRALLFPNPGSISHDDTYYTM